MPVKGGSASGLYSLLRYVGTMASSVVIADAFRSPLSIGILYASLVGASSLSFLLSFLMPRSWCGGVDIPVAAGGLGEAQRRGCPEGDSHGAEVKPVETVVEFKEKFRPVSDPGF